MENPHGPGARPAGVLTRLPGDGNQMALTVDDGTSVPVVGAFAQFCQDTGTRLTFFVNGVNTSWSVNAPALRPMVDSGQIQMGNHTWSHPYLNRIGLSAVADQIRRNADFLTKHLRRERHPVLLFARRCSDHSDAGSQGGFNWSLQHLDFSEVCSGLWERQLEVRGYRVRFPRRDGRRWPGARTGSGSGRPLLRVR